MTDLVTIEAKAVVGEYTKGIKTKPFDGFHQSSMNGLADNRFHFYNAIRTSVAYKHNSISLFLTTSVFMNFNFFSFPLLLLIFVRYGNEYDAFLCFRFNINCRQFQSAPNGLVARLCMEAIKRLRLLMRASLQYDVLTFFFWYKNNNSMTFIRNKSHLRFFLCLPK